MLRLWVCEACGDTFELEGDCNPYRDSEGRVLCDIDREVDEAKRREGYGR